MTQSTALSPVQQVYQNIDLMKEKFAAALPPHVSSEKFTRVAITAIQNTADLQQIAAQSPAARNSILNACSKAAADGLMPDGREGAIVAFNRKVSAKGSPDKWEKHAQWMPMVEGLRKMVRNSGEISNISVQVVREGDNFDYQLGDQEYIIHKPALKKRGNIIGAYSIATLKSGEKSREYMDVDEIQAVRERSKSKDSGPWKTDYSEMCRKTVFRRHYKSLPKSTDLDKIIDNDEDYSEAPIMTVHETPVPPQITDGQGSFSDEREVEQKPARKPRTSARATAAAMKPADVVDNNPSVAAGKKSVKPTQEDEIQFDNNSGYSEEEEDVV